MEISLFNLLTLAEFKVEHNPDIMAYGYGSIMNGKTATVTKLKNNMYNIKFHSWGYSCDGELEYEIKEDRTVQDSNTWKFLNSEFKFLK